MGVKWTENQKNYTIKATPKDSFSPDMILTVYEDGKAISVSAIKYTDGVTLCSGSNTTVSKGDISGESSFLVVLTNGNTVKATLV